MSNILPGTFKARVIDYQVTVSRGGDPRVIMRFQWGDGNRYNWYGNFSTEKSTERSLKALLACGYKGDGDLSQLADGTESGVLDLNKEVEIVVSLETGTDGVERPVIQWVNDPDISVGVLGNAVSKGEAKRLFGGLNLKNKIGMLRNDLGYTKKGTAKSAATSENQAPNLDDIPF